jgi:hypothetical protein
LIGLQIELDRRRLPRRCAEMAHVLVGTLTVLTLGLSDRLRQLVAPTNAIESLISRTR